LGPTPVGNKNFSERGRDGRGLAVAGGHICKLGCVACARPCRCYANGGHVKTLSVVGGSRRLTWTADALATQAVCVSRALDTTLSTARVHRCGGCGLNAAARGGKAGSGSVCQLLVTHQKPGSPFLIPTLHPSSDRLGRAPVVIAFSQVEAAHLLVAHLALRFCGQACRAPVIMLCFRTGQLLFHPTYRNSRGLQRLSTGHSMARITHCRWGTW